MIKPCLIIFGLVIIIIFMILLILKKDSREHLNIFPLNGFHDSDTCKPLNSIDEVTLRGNGDDSDSNHPFENDECSIENQDLGHLNIHINNQHLNITTGRRIHIVNPNNPCCLRTCINDFTDVDDKEGNLRPEFRSQEGNQNLHYFFSSKCDECISNFYSPVSLIREARRC